MEDALEANYEEGIEDGVKQGYDSGIQVGTKRGELQKLIQQICTKLTKEKTPELIAEELEEDIVIVRKICAAAQEYDSTMDVEKLNNAYCFFSTSFSLNTLNPQTVASALLQRLPFFYCWCPDLNAGLPPAPPHRKELVGVLTWVV